VNGASNIDDSYFRDRRPCYSLAAVWSLWHVRLMRASAETQEVISVTGQPHPVLVPLSSLSTYLAPAKVE